METIKRPSIDDYFLRMAELVSIRGTCIRRKVGCILVDSNKHVMATGYNGPPRNLPHCIDFPCPGAKYSTGQGLDKCLATHAEQNALLQCPDVEKIETCYTTVSPCIQCVKLLLNTSCKRIVFNTEYIQKEVKQLWKQAGREWILYTDQLQHHNPYFGNNIREVYHVFRDLLNLLKR